MISSASIVFFPKRRFLKFGAVGREVAIELIG
jgi:hypothetical protein